jgi:hypothetical protein
MDWVLVVSSKFELEKMNIMKPIQLKDYFKIWQKYLSVAKTNRDYKTH